jgi:hypothetical protein
MTDSNPDVPTLVWRVVIACLVVLARLALDRLAIRGQPRRSRRARH